MSYFICVLLSIHGNLRGPLQYHVKPPRNKVSWRDHGGLIILNNKDLGFPGGETWHRGVGSPLNSHGIASESSAFKTLHSGIMNKSPIQVVATQTCFYVHPYRYLEKWSNLTNTFQMGCHDPLKKSQSWWFPAFFRSLLPVETGWNHQLAMFSNHTLHRSPSQYPGGRNSPKCRFRALGASWHRTNSSVDMSGVFKWNRSMVDQPTSYI